MKNNFIIFVSAAFSLLVVSCNSDTGIDIPQEITMPTEITQMQEQYSDFDPKAVIEILTAAPIWIDEVLVDCIRQNGQLVEARTVFDRDGYYMIPGQSNIFAFSANNVRSFTEPEIPPFPLIYRDYPMQYDPDTRIITTTEIWSDGSTHQYETKVLAMTDDRIMLEGSIGNSFTTTLDYGAGPTVFYPDTFYREILYAGTQADLDAWKDAVDGNDTIK